MTISAASRNLTDLSTTDMIPSPLSIEAFMSQELLQSRQAQSHRELRRHKRHHHNNKHHKHHHEEDFTVERKPRENTQHGMMIDAGSQGTRIHVYEFAPRILATRKELKQAASGRKLSFPTTDTHWTDRLKPGLDAFAFVEDDHDMLQQVAAYLEPLLDFAKAVLSEKEKHWHHYPIYLKATGGLRTLPRPYRLRLMKIVRELFRDKAFNPFMYHDEHARVISGEEEAIYGWTAVNFAQGTLLPNMEGVGTVSHANKTFGVLEMGGASTQIGFFEPNGDVMANLFKLQLGGARHFNVYTHSWLWFGVNGAYSRLNARLFTEAMLDPKHNDTAKGVYNPCLPGGSEYYFTSRVHLLPDGSLLPLSRPDDPSILEADFYSAIMRNDNEQGDFEMCNSIVHKLLRKEANQWCNFAHDRDCSFAGIYQPPLPINDFEFGFFIATSNFYHVWDFLGLESQSSLTQVRQGARRICSMSLEELQAYNQKRPRPLDDDDLTQYCFRATFVASFLIDGVGFPETYNVTAVDVLNGQKLGWALGSMLYEINTLPWKFEGSLLHRVAPRVLVDMFDDDMLEGGGDIIVVLFGLLVAAVGIMKLLLSLNWTRRPCRARQVAEMHTVETESLTLHGTDRRDGYAHYGST